MGCWKSCQNHDNETNFEMDDGTSFKNTARSRVKNYDKAPMTFSNEIRYAEVDVSLYSEFSDEEYSTQNNSSNDWIKLKEMFNK